MGTEEVTWDKNLWKNNEKVLDWWLFTIFAKYNFTQNLPRIEYEWNFNYIMYHLLHLLQSRLRLFRISKNTFKRLLLKTGQKCNKVIMTCQASAWVITTLFHWSPSLKYLLSLSKYTIALNDYLDYLYHWT